MTPTRVFCAVRHSTDPRKFHGGLWSGNFYPALRQLGHEVVESQVDLLPASRFMDVASRFSDEQKKIRSRITEQILREVAEAHAKSPIGLFLSYFYNSHFDPAGFEQIHQLGIPTVNFYCNSIYQFELVAQIAAKVRYAWHAEKEARDRYLKVGANPTWVQMGSDPVIYRPREQITRQERCCFVGQRYADRDRWAAGLLSAKIPLDLYGEGWPGATMPAGADAASHDRGNRLAGYLHAAMDNIHRNGPIGGLRRTVRQWHYRTETRKLNPVLAPASRGYAAGISETFARYAVVLNFSNVWADGRAGSDLIPHVRLRDFEAPMCRACYLTGYTDELAEFYELGKEVDTYRTPEELADKTRYYLSHPTAAEALREGGYRRAIRDHTWRRRFEELFGKIGVGS
jgi:spore maturation protein CgeB